MSQNKIRKLVSDADRKRRNRVYYEKCFRIKNINDAGIISSKDKSDFDRFALDSHRNDSLEVVAFDQNGSYFNLNFALLSLYPTDEGNSRWQLAEASLVYFNSIEECKYTYSHEQLIETSESTLETYTDQLTIGSISYETICPFNIYRILFNGLIKRQSKDGKEELVSARINIIAHANCDKLDYKYRFDPDYLVNSIQKSLTENTDAKTLLEIALEDRIDQSCMFQGKVELLNFTGNNSESKASTDFLMWGSKIKRFLEPREELKATGSSEQRENLFIWAECGHTVHLTRPIRYPDLVYGMVSSNFDYASCLNDANLFQTNEETDQVEVKFEQLDSLAKLSAGKRISLRAFKMKNYSIEICQSMGADCGLSDLIRVKVNNFNGWGLVNRSGSGKRLRLAQARLWSLDIHDRKFSQILASEQLLGGKGNSLIELNRLSQDGLLSLRHERNISVPKGLVVSCVAYQLWLSCNPLIMKSIQELDSCRLSLAARSIFVNPFSDKHLPVTQSQQILREQCKKTRLLLNSCPLPASLRAHLYRYLVSIFSENELQNPKEDEEEEESVKRKLFAVRSSAVGEDSLETSAAGQMTTFLDVKGFDSICRSIVDCWSSQFDLEAVTYKTQNGLDLNLPMAVVVQELVSCCFAAGVAATCNPVTGDKNYLEILANLGLGEGVVAGNKADSIRVSLKSLIWNEEREEHSGCLSLETIGKDDIEIVHCATNEKCCLSKEQIVALANLLIELRRSSKMGNREVEWAITLNSNLEITTSSSSSSSSSESTSCSEGNSKFHIHLLQSRPLTNLNRLSEQEIDHELDSGYSSPLDIVSRANLGEVMPGSSCTLNITYFVSITSSYYAGKPHAPDHTNCRTAANAFGFYGTICNMLFTNTDTLVRFKGLDDEGESILRTMIGTTLQGTVDFKELKLVAAERMNPLAKPPSRSLAKVLAFDACGHRAITLFSKQKAARCVLEGNLSSIESYIELIEKTDVNRNKLRNSIEADIKKLFDRLCTQTCMLCDAWNDHILATLLSMSFNVICMRVLASQPSYPDDVGSKEVLNDFSILIQGGKQTESGDISRVLDDIVDALVKENHLNEVQSMNKKELYDFLTLHSANFQSGEFFRKFMRKNGHRSYNEFNLSTQTWGDNPNYVINSLATRLKQYSSDDIDQNRKQLEQRVKERDEELKRILARVEKARFPLSNYLLPRARNAVARREKSKSNLIKTIARYRHAFRHLGALLCLVGRLPQAELVFYMTMDELVKVVNDGCKTELSRILFKARRRQQRARVLDSLSFPQPTIKMLDMVENFGQLYKVSEASCSNDILMSENNSVKGMTSCGGCVTGRAFVVRDLEDMDKVEANDILITYSIDISWSVYFFTLSGIVTEIGGIVSHGAVVAREYGIPTLCTAIGACSKFKTGQLVTLDANQGVCYLANAGKENDDSK